VLNNDRIDLISVAPLFAEAVMRIVNRESLGDLFDRIPETVFEQSLLLTKIE
jgi:ribose-phosphate pyrophosphokinase